MSLAFKQIVFFLLATVWLPVAIADAQIKRSLSDKFRQLEEVLPTANVYRTASGAPGIAYWQQQVDYEIEVQIDDKTQHLTGSEEVTYKNNSPDRLNYLWLQLDANIRDPNSDSHQTQTHAHFNRMEFDRFHAMLEKPNFDGGFKITRCQTADQRNDLKYSIVKTMMRIDLPEPLAPDGTFRFSIDWNYKIPDQKVLGHRSGYEYFKEDKNYLYEMAQWFPRLCAYTDVTGWQHKQFLGRGEFTLEMGDYLVRITMPKKHVVTATGTLINPDEVLNDKWQARLKNAQTADAPVFIITPEEAKANQGAVNSSSEDTEGSDENDTKEEVRKDDATATKTWIFKANRVRDFAFASSKKFIWDAQQCKVGNKPVMAMSFYPNEAEWDGVSDDLF